MVGIHWWCLLATPTIVVAIIRKDDLDSWKLFLKNMFFFLEKGFFDAIKK